MFSGRGGTSGATLTSVSAPRLLRSLARMRTCASSESNALFSPEDDDQVGVLECGLGQGPPVHERQRIAVDHRRLARAVGAGEGGPVALDPVADLLPLRLVRLAALDEYPHALASGGAVRGRECRCEVRREVLWPAGSRANVERREEPVPVGHGLPGGLTRARPASRSPPDDRHGALERAALDRQVTAGDDVDQHRGAAVGQYERAARRRPLAERLPEVLARQVRGLEQFARDALRREGGDELRPVAFEVRRNHADHHPSGTNGCGERA